MNRVRQTKCFWPTSGSLLRKKGSIEKVLNEGMISVRAAANLFGGDKPPIESTGLCRPGE